MKDTTKFWLFLLLVCVIIITPILTFQYKINTKFADWNFCEEMEYSYDVDVNGNYLDYKDKDYGMVKCYLCYADGCTRESFNVSRDWRGKLIKHDIQSETNNEN